MEAYVLKSLKKLRKETPRRFTDLRALCDQLIGSVLFIYCTKFLYVSDIIGKI
jgi:hypothetical protein